MDAPSKPSADSRCRTRAKSYLSTNQRNLAVSYLRSRKALEEVLEKRLGVAEQLRGLVRSIDQAQSDTEVRRGSNLDPAGSCCSRLTPFAFPPYLIDP